MAHFAAQPLAGCSETNVLEWDGQLDVAAGGALGTGSWGKGATYTKGSNGEYTLTLDAKYRVANAGHGNLTYGLIKAAAGLQGVEIKSQDFSTGVFVFRFTETAVAGAGTDPAAAVKLNIHIRMFNTSLTKG
jgi:hypothetical protein